MIVYDPKRRHPNWVPGSWDYLAELLPKDAACFEWGGGQSTFWLAERVPDGSVLTVENVVAWLERTHEMTKQFDNCDILWAPRQSRRYLNSVHVGEGHNVYLIDGYQRWSCLALTQKLWMPGDIVVLDDALDFVADFKMPGPVGEIFRMPHPSPGAKISDPTLSLLTHCAKFKETWVFQVPGEVEEPDFEI